MRKYIVNHMIKTVLNEPNIHVRNVQHIGKKSAGKSRKIAVTLANKYQEQKLKKKSFTTGQFGTYL